MCLLFVEGEKKHNSRAGFEMQIFREAPVIERDDYFSGFNSTNCFFKMFFEWPSLSLLHNQEFLIAQRDSSLLMLLFFKFMYQKFHFES